MESKHQVHNLIILDESGSMGSIKDIIIGGFNELLQTIKGIEKEFTEQEHLITFITFNGMGKKLLHFIDPVDSIKEIDGKLYNPHANTPLFDAIGFGINKLQKYLQEKKNYNVLVTILTDGLENASKEYSGKHIKDLIEELKQNKWTFTYIGTDHNVDEFASLISINNKKSFNKNKEGISKMFEEEQHSRVLYSYKIKNNLDTTSDFYEESK